MDLIWLMLLLPVNVQEHVTVFPKSFATKEACESLGQILIVQREFRCIKSERRVEVAVLAEGWLVPPPAFAFDDAG